MHLFYIFLGGGLGAVSRYGLAAVIQQLTHNTRIERFPIGIYACNMLGCLLIGIAVGFLSSRSSYPNWINLFTVTGFLGGFTTFSTFALDNHKHFLTSPSIAFLNIGLSIIGSIIAVWIGFKIAS